MVVHISMIHYATLCNTKSLLRIFSSCDAVQKERGRKVTAIAEEYRGMLLALTSQFSSAHFQNPFPFS